MNVKFRVLEEKNQVKGYEWFECGIVLSKFNEVIQNDRLEFFVREKVKKILV